VVVFFGRDSRHSGSLISVSLQGIEHYNIDTSAALKDFPAPLESRDFDHFTLTEGGYYR
jgi:hypothetical protein